MAVQKQGLDNNRVVYAVGMLSRQSNIRCYLLQHSMRLTV